MSEIKANPELILRIKMTCIRKKKHLFISSLLFLSRFFNHILLFFIHLHFLSQIVFSSTTVISFRLAIQIVLLLMNRTLTNVRNIFYHDFWTIYREYQSIMVNCQANQTYLGWMLIIIQKLGLEQTAYVCRENELRRYTKI